MPEDLVLNGEFSRIGKFETVRPEQLDAVVLPWIMRGGDDDTCGETVGVGKEGNSGGGDDTGALDRRSSGSQAGSQRGRDPITGFAGIHAQKNAGQGSCG